MGGVIYKVALVLLFAGFFLSFFSLLAIGLVDNEDTSAIHNKSTIKKSANI